MARDELRCQYDWRWSQLGGHGVAQLQLAIKLVVEDQQEGRGEAPGEAAYTTSVR